MWLLLPFAVFGAWSIFTGLQAKSHHQTIQEAMSAQRVALSHFLHIGNASHEMEADAHAHAALAAVNVAANKIAEAGSKSTTPAQQATTASAQHMLDGISGVVEAVQAMKTATTDQAKQAAAAAFATACLKVASGEQALTAAGLEI